MTGGGVPGYYSGVPHVPRWTIADLVDFEYLLADEGRARQVPALATKAADRRTLFRGWVEEARKTQKGELPGHHFTGAWHILLTLAVIVGFALGFGVAGSHLSYHGNEPINLPKLLLWTVGVQWLLLVLVLVFWLFRRALPDLRDFYPLHALLWTVDFALRRMPGEQRDALRATIGRLRHRHEVYGSLMVWPTLIATQLFAVTFNLGVLVAVLLLGQVVALRFGWQTTPDLSAETAYQRVAALATPWQWAPNPHPTAAQVAASRYEPGQDLRELDVAATRAWWPFLMYAVVVYGLLVRGALLVFAMVRLRQDIAGVRFDHAEANALYRRLTGPVIHAESDSTGLVIPSEKDVLPARAAGAALALISSDVEIEEATVAEQLQRLYQWRVLGVQKLEIDRPHANQAVLESLRSRAEEVVAIPVIVRAKRAPIRAMALVLEEIRTTAAKPELLLLLLGRKSGDSFAPVPAEELQHWKNFSAINGLHLGVEAWKP